MHRPPVARPVSVMVINIIIGFELARATAGRRWLPEESHRQTAALGLGRDRGWAPGDNSYHLRSPWRTACPRSSASAGPLCGRQSQLFP